jgi:hypothetical protein
MVFKASVSWVVDASSGMIYSFQLAPDPVSVRGGQLSQMLRRSIFTGKLVKLRKLASAAPVKYSILSIKPECRWLQCKQFTDLRQVPTTSAVNSMPTVAVYPWMVSNRCTKIQRFLNPAP